MRISAALGLTTSLISMSWAASAQTTQQQPAPTQQSRLTPPPVESMSRQDLRDAVTSMRPFVENGGVRAEGRPQGCSSGDQSQFDFWLGEWDVSPTANDQMVIGESTISSHAQGCIIEEYWRPFRGAEGRSINGYNAIDQRWHQYFMSATGRQTHYRGEFRGGVMSLENMTGVGPGVVEGSRARMNFQAIDANTVRQWGENYDAASDRWTVTWDVTYRRRPNSGR